MRLNLNNDDRAPVDMSPEKVPSFCFKLLTLWFQQTQFYKSLHSLLKLLRDPSYEIEFQLVPGHVLIMDNWRVLHGRRSFTGHRRMLGCYFSYEDLQSRRIVTELQHQALLEERVQKKNEDKQQDKDPKPLPLLEELHHQQPLQKPLPQTPIPLPIGKQTPKGSFLNWFKFASANSQG